MFGANLSRRTNIERHRYNTEPFGRVSVHIEFDLLFAMQTSTSELLSLVVPEWVDDQAVNHFFLPLPASREIDRDNWDSSINFWEKTIFAVHKELKNLSFTLDDLKTRFKRKGVVPLSLEGVLVLHPLS